MKGLFCVLSIVLLFCSLAVPCSGAGCACAGGACAVPPTTTQTVEVEVSAVVDLPHPMRWLWHRLIRQPIVAPVAPVVAPAVVPDVAPAFDGKTYGGTYKLYHAKNGTIILTPTLPEDKKVGDFHGGHGGPGPQPFHGGGDFHGGGFRQGGYGGYHGGWGNPWNYVAPLVINYATEPRPVMNPMTGQTEMLPPGQWVANPPGSPVPFVYVRSMAWNLLGATAGQDTEGPIINAVVRPIKKIIEVKPVRSLIGRIVRR
jgi:hypothetical protein